MNLRGLIALSLAALSSGAQAQAFPSKPITLVVPFSPGGPRYFEIDEAFDRWFLSLLEAGDTPRAFAECTLERMREAGAGGTPELIAWFVAWGAASGAKARVVCYEPTASLRCSMGGVVWS